MTHRRIATNGVELHTVIEGEGPPVVLLHGFPELWFSWRDQIPALAAAGHRVIAPDLRGFGASSAPADPALYDTPTLSRDVSGLLDALGEDDAVLVGHDLGAMLAWFVAVDQPERMRAVAGLSVPAMPRGPAPPATLLREHLGEDFYIAWFQEPGEADAALAADVRRTLTAREVWSRAWAAKDEQPRPAAGWLGEENLQVYVEAYERTGFTGGLNWYRAFDRSWERTAHLEGRRVEQPALFLTGERDPVAAFAPAALMEGHVTDLRASVVVEGAGHWVNQERPDAVNAALLEFLDGL
jgi:pimeloyl-ACP methyl ester carboxylesterase